ncbi:hypothetical protein L596_018891 [Steinernema carpocapsae]|uniref:Vacuolar protein sorting-associated protein 16 homolog n=1 Tax=Steinernema carpocapsae TaxID=34508 RepID=A0A4U5N602_STECR|nr:hypothetical protein L596_018891 [Steinernema carpocapsae]
MTSAGNWVYLKPVNLQHVDLYSDLNLPIRDGTVLFAACEFGGPIAIAVSRPNSDKGKWDIALMTSSGIPLIEEPVEAYNVMTIAWTKDHRLLVLERNRRVSVYTPMGVREENFMLGPPSTDSPLQWKVFSNHIEGKMCHSGLAVLTKSNQIVVTDAVQKKVAWPVDLHSKQSITAWTVFSSATSPPTVILAVDGQIQMARHGAPARNQNFPWVIPDIEGVYVEIIPNWDHSQLALFNSSGQIQIVDCENCLVLQTIKFKYDETVIGYFWCGNEALCVQTPNELTFYSRESEEYSVSMFDKVFIDMELDGIKVFSKSKLTFYTVVNENLEAVFKIGTECPGTYLHEAALKHREKSHLVYDFIKYCKGKESKAIEECLYAAAYTYEPERQEELLEAAKLGKSIDKKYDSSRFVAICKEIRVLHTVRMMRVGIPLSFAQLTELKPNPLLNRLIELRHWPAAMEVARYMEIPEDEGVHRVLGYWASHLIEECKLNGGIAREVDEKIFNKLKDFAAINYANIAEKAYKTELPELAELLLNREKRKARQVELLLKISRSDPKKDQMNNLYLNKAVTIASKSQQPDLIYLVMSHVKRHGKATEVDLLVRKWPQARALLEASYRDESPKHLEALYRQNDDYVRQAMFYIGKAMASNSPFETEENVASLKKAQECLNRNRGRDLSYIGHLSEIINIQRLSGEWDITDGGGSLREVFIWAVSKDIEQSNAKKAPHVDQLTKAFRISDKQIYMWKIEAFVNGRHFSHLDQLARSRRSPIGYLPFIKALTVRGYIHEAEKLMDRINDYEEQIKAYLLMEKPLQAAKIAFDRKNRRQLNKIRTKYCRNLEVNSQLSKYINALQ